MTEDDIAQRFIDAAKVERKLPKKGEGPRAEGSAMPAYVHSYEDKLNWRNIPSEKGNQLEKGEDPLSEERTRFWQGRTSRPSTEDVTAWEQCIDWTVTLVTDEGRRRALWGWAFARAGGRNLNEWADLEGISTKTARKRKNAAVSEITCKLAGNVFSHNENGQKDGLLEDPENRHKSATVGHEGEAEQRAYTWRSDLSLRPAIRPELSDFSWAEQRNARRRQVEASAKAVASGGHR